MGGAERSVEDMCAQHAEIAAQAVREGSDRLMFRVPKVPGLEEITAHLKDLQAQMSTLADRDRMDQQHSLDFTQDMITRTASLETSVSFLRCQLEILRGETGLSSAKLCRGSETLEGEDRSRLSDQTQPSFVWPNSCELQGTVVGKATGSGRAETPSRCRAARFVDIHRPRSEPVGRICSKYGGNPSGGRCSARRCERLLRAELRWLGGLRSRRHLR